MPALIECVPNFSEARRPEVVQAIVDAMRAVPGVRVLDVSADRDHNRTVVTCVGDATAMEAGAFAAIATAAALIDLDQHRGEHPRIGATDVVPFIPLRQATMGDCIALAQRLGERVGRELGIPVYLYEAAATRPDRQNLAHLRRGQYEGLKSAIETDPERRPDFGPARLGTAGATAIGARPLLIAYNVYLNTSDVGIAKKIARAVRYSSGGLRYVKALGLLVGGQAQVSMNVTDFRHTPVHRVVDMIRREAARYGTSVLRSELVGLMPQAALVDAAQWYLQLDGLQDEHIIEHKLAMLDQPQGAGASAQAFLEALASGSAAPGGGAAAAYTGAMAAALVAMVARLTVANKHYADVATEMQAVLSQAEALRAAFTANVGADTAAFTAVTQAYHLPKDSAPETTRRAMAIEQALHMAVAVPLQVARDALRVLDTVATVAAKGNSKALSDAGSAASLALAALRAAALNVRTNAAAVQEREAARVWLDDITRLEEQAVGTADTVHRLVQNRML